MTFRHSAHKPDGIVISTDFEGKQTEQDTLQCVHCGMHWVVLPGSGRKRGFCLKCSGVLCGKRECMTVCAPIEARLEAAERGQPIMF